MTTGSLAKPNLSQKRFVEIHDKLDTFKIRDPANLTFRLNHHLALQHAIQEVNPKNILEIGFLVGHSSLMWLTFSDARVWAIDRIVDKGAHEATALLKSEFGERFSLDLADVTAKDWVKTLKGREFDLVFLDAGLDGEAVAVIESFRHHTKYFLFDCWLHKRYISVLDEMKEKKWLRHVCNYKTINTTMKLFEVV